MYASRRRLLTRSRRRQAETGRGERAERRWYGPPANGVNATRYACWVLKRALESPRPPMLSSGRLQSATQTSGPASPSRPSALYVEGLPSLPVPALLGLRVRRSRVLHTCGWGCGYVGCDGSRGRRGCVARSAQTVDI